MYQIGSETHPLAPAKSAPKTRLRNPRRTIHLETLLIPHPCLPKPCFQAKGAGLQWLIQPITQPRLQRLGSRNLRSSVSQDQAGQVLICSPQAFLLAVPCVSLIPLILTGQKSWDWAMCRATGNWQALQDYQREAGEQVAWQMGHIDYKSESRAFVYFRPRV